MKLFYALTTWELILVFLSAFLIGSSKAGIKGVGLLIVPIMAGVFGAKQSTGIVLPMLILADIMAVIYYRKSVNWRYIRKLIPWALSGILAGVFTGTRIPEDKFKYLLGAIIISMLVLLIYNDLKKRKKIPDSTLFSASLGLAGGFATMVGNAAGPVFSIYLLSMRLPKKEFIGTGAWFFFIVNITKVPFHILAWHTIKLETIVFDLLLLPLIIFGMFVGIRLVNLFPEKAYRYFVIIMTTLAAVVLFVN